MNKPLIRIHNTETDEIIDREMNDIEFEEYQKRKKLFENEQLQAEAKATALQEILDRLGLTADEAKLLLG